MNTYSQTQNFIKYAQKYVPRLKVAFKDQSRFMKVLGALMFFNKSFMTRYTTTIGYTIYVPSKEDYDANPDAYLDILTHEFVHMIDFKKWNVLFSLSYLLPQLLAAFSVLSFLAINHSHYWLFSSLSLLFAAPIPAFFRSHWEMRGYVMNAAYNYWKNDYKNLEPATTYLDRFTSSGYFFMWPFKKNMTARLQNMLNKVEDNSILIDTPYRIVHDWIVNVAKVNVL